MKASREAELLFNKFVKQVDKIFKNLPKSLEWQSFYTHDLALLVDICKELQDISIQQNQERAYKQLAAKPQSYLTSYRHACLLQARPACRRHGRLPKLLS